MIEELLSNPIPAIGAILLAAWVGHIAYRNSRKSRLAEAAATFRSSIAPSAFSGMRGHQLHGALIRAYPVHREAAKEFRRYLGPITKYRFERAWRAYHRGDEEHPEFTPYYIRESGPETLFLRLEALKRAANQT
jgi:hypothetical protein